MSAGDEYKRNAAECLRVASELTDPHRRLAMLEMAQAWSRLADQAERNKQTDIVYEVPSRPPLNPDE
jgi:hypothetical protein